LRDVGEKEGVENIDDIIEEAEESGIQDAEFER
jgi:hypothetical protein